MAGGTVGLKKCKKKTSEWNYSFESMDLMELSLRFHIFMRIDCK